MKFSCDNKILSNAIQTSTLKGKYYTSSGLKNKFLCEYLYLVCKGNALTIYNSDETLCLTLNITVEGVEDGSSTIEGNTLITYLKKFSDNVTLEFKDYLTMRGAGKTAKMALVVNHPHMNMINNFNWENVPPSSGRGSDGKDSSYPIVNNLDRKNSAKITKNRPLSAEVK